MPPHDPEAEAGALACVLCADGEAEAMLDQLDASDFYDHRHREVYTALHFLRKAGKPLGVVALAQRLRDTGTTDDAGGTIYIATLPDQTPSEANFPTFLDTVRDRATRRATVRDAVELANLAQDPRITKKTLGDAARRMVIRDYHPSDQIDPAVDLGVIPAPLPEIIDAAEFRARILEHPPELIQGILHQGSKLVLGGGSKSFKTWCLLDLAISVAHGVPWLGRQTQQGRVLYINFEIQPWSWQKRIEAVSFAKEITIEPGRLSLWNLRGRAANFDTLLPEVRERIQQDYALVILDPIYKLYGQTDENSAGDVARLMNAVEELSVKSGAATAFGAHFSKGNQASKESMDRISGSGVFARDPDSLLVLTRHEEDDAFTVEPTLRNFAPVEPFVVRWNYPLMVPDTSLDQSKLKQVGGRHRNHDPDKLCAAIVGTSAENPISISEWAHAADVNRSTLQGYLPGLRAKGWIATSGEGSSARQYLTEHGREAAIRHQKA